MYYVYILRSLTNLSQTYIGMTASLQRRLQEHNRGESSHTRRFRPWEIETYVAFSEKHLAEQFEQYLKHGSGWAFAKKHLLKL